jgi:hypothetical protein
MTVSRVLDRTVIVLAWSQILVQPTKLQLTNEKWVHVQAQQLGNSYKLLLSQFQTTAGFILLCFEVGGSFFNSSSVNSRKSSLSVQFYNIVIKTEN